MKTQGLTNQTGESKYLDLDQLLYAVNDEEVLIPRWRRPNKNLIACLQPTTILVPHKCLRVGLLVVEVTRHDVGTLDEELAALLVLGDLVAVGVDDLGPLAWYEEARGADEDVGLDAGSL